VDPTSFPKGMVSGSACVNMFGWNTRCADLAAKTNEKKCFHHDSCKDTILTHIEDDQMSALSACCAFDGGISTGATLLMENASPLRCATLSNVSSDVVFCECSDENQRYDVRTSSCISSCNSGERWEYVDSSKYDTISSEVGRCVACSVGMFSVGSVNSWIDTCLNCTAGWFVSSNRSSECRQCDPGTYTSSDGQSQCQICPRGKHSDLTKSSTECVECIPGRFSSKNGTSLCSPCPRGRYSTQNASTECNICKSGYHTKGLEVGSTSCVQCNVGTFIIFAVLIEYTLLFS
jgi:hypothetical protein